VFHQAPVFEPQHDVPRNTKAATVLHLESTRQVQNINDTTMLSDTIDLIRVPTERRGRPCTRPERVLADKGYPSRSNRSYLASRGIKATIPDRADQRQNRVNKGSAGGRPTGFDAEIYKGRNVVERSFNRLKNWRGIAMRSDKTARNYQAGVTLAATLIWLNTDLFNTA
jgi:transposase